MYRARVVRVERRQVLLIFLPLSTSSVPFSPSHTPPRTSAADSIADADQSRAQHLPTPS